MKKFGQFFFLALGLVYLSACVQSPEGQKVETGEAKEVAATQGKELSVDLGASKVEWVGTKVGGQHNGDLKIKSGTVKIEGGKLVAGSFVLDMTSINVLDIDEANGKGKLEGHLKADDFFGVEKFPEGKFEISSVEEKAGEEGATHLIVGNLTLKGVTKSVSIPAKVTISDSSVEASTPQFLVERQQFGVSYQNPVKEKALSDDMGIKITLVAK